METKQKYKHHNTKRLKVVTFASAVIMMLLGVIRIYDTFIDKKSGGISWLIPMLLGTSLIVSNILSKSKWHKLSAWLLICAYATPTIFSMYIWGADLPAAILMSVLVVMFAGFFLGAKAAACTASTFVAVIISLSWLQSNNIISTDNTWRNNKHELGDAVAYVLIFGLTFLLAWLSAKDNKLALAAAEDARIELAKERDDLEIKAEERAKELVKEKKEKMEQLQALASIGQISGSILHDIVNPLTVVSINLEEMRTEGCLELSTSQESLKQALSATERIKEIISAASSCLKRQNPEEYFSLKEELTEIIRLMSATAKSKNVFINFLTDKDFSLKGGKTRFGQVAMNLIANAIESCGQTSKENKNITIQIKEIENGEKLAISFTDNGRGIDAKNIDRIFEAFFSTKSTAGKNLGLGLSIVKEIVEKDFHGSVTVKSQEGEGCTFTLLLPQC